MRTSISLLLAAMAVAVISTAQPPQAFKYQAVVRDAAGELVSNQTVSFRLKILDGGPAGTQIYMEAHSCTTNDFGLVNLSVGEGSVQYGTFSGIDWASGSKYLKVEYDPAGGTSYVSLGTSELQSVPYAIYSGRSADSYWEKLNGNLFYDDGNVGIDVTNPAYPLHVKSSASDTWLAGFHNTHTGSASHGVVIRSDGGDPLLVQRSIANLFCVKANGNVGVLTTTPDAPLHVDDRIRVGEDPSNPSVYGELIHTGGSNGFRINANAGGTWADMYFQTDGTTKMFLESAGNVGIGTTSLSNARLTIEGAGAYDAMVKINNTGTDGAEFFMGSTNSAWGGGTNADRFVMGYGAPSSANIDLCVLSSGNVGIGTTLPVARLEVVAASGTAVSGSSPGTGVYGFSSGGNGVFGHSNTGKAGYFSGDVYVSGSIDQGGGSFVIDHPLDPENKLLRHNFVESPENLVIYRGKASLNGVGEATVSMPDYFMALTKEDEASIHLTPVGRPFMTGAEWNGDFSALVIYGDANREVYWEVLADRDDPVIHELGRPVVEEKGGEHSLCEKGKLLHPRAYGYPESAGMDYDMLKMAEKENR